MPAGDRTGPMGLGPMTGRRAGYCAGYDAPGYANPAAPRLGLRRRRGRGARGGGRGWRHWYYATGLPGWMRFSRAPAWGAPPTQPLTREQEIESLNTQAEWLKGQLDTTSQRIAELEREK